ncbi:hypothetical protein HG531_004431 [Fusarium graminearum]|nr:hypothetical protein HG531_004431 [Fusarium graminearum]
MSDSASSSSSSVGALGGEKKLKKDSVGTVFLTIRSSRTLVSLLLALDTDGQVLTRRPVNLVTLGVVVDEVTTVAALVLVVVCLGDGGVAEEVVGSELEDEAETGLVKVLHADVSEVLKSSLITVSDHLGERDLVLHGRKPELGDTGNIVGNIGLCLRLGGGIIIIDLLIVLLAGLDLVLSRLGLSVDDGGTLLVERRELGEVLLLKLENLFLELGLELGVVLLDTLETSDTSADRGGKGLDVARRLAHERAEATLNHLDKLGVLGENRGRGSTVQILYSGVRAWFQG